MRLAPLLLCLALLPACAKGRPAPRIEVSRPQPVLREALLHLADAGLPGARDATIFILSHWLMYEDDKVEGTAWQPRYETASFTHDGARIKVAAGPVAPWWEGEAPATRPALTPSLDERTGRPNGLTIVPAGQSWRIGYTIDPAPPADDELRQRVEGLLVGWARQRAGPESVGARPEDRAAEERR